MEGHAGRGQIAGWMAAQDARRQTHEAVPEGGLDPRCPASFDSHHRGARKQVQHGPEHPETGHRQSDRVERARVAACRDVMRNEAERNGGQKLDQTARKPGDDQPQPPSGGSMQRDREQIRRLRFLRRQRPVENPGVPRQGAGAGCGHPGAALGARFDLPVAPEHSRQQRDRLAVGLAECQHRVAVPAPPVVVGVEPDPAGAHARRIENVA